VPIAPKAFDMNDKMPKSFTLIFFTFILWCASGTLSKSVVSEVQQIYKNLEEFAADCV
jgi:outer membrane lipoprotein-sorting protein